MYRNLNKIILFIIIISAYISFIHADELELLPNNSAKPTGTPFKLILKNIKDKPTQALVQIREKSPNNKFTIYKKWTEVNNNKSFTLPKGLFQVIIDGGLRRIKQIINIAIPNHLKQIHKLTIKPYAPVEPAGWIMIDPLFNNYAEIPAAILRKNAKALEIRSVFSTNINNKEISFTNINNINNTLIAPVKKTVHANSGMYFSFLSSDNSNSTTKYLQNNLLYQQLFTEHDQNNLTAISPYIFDPKLNKKQPKPAEEFIFDTITGPLYDVLLLPDLTESLKIWHTLLNLNYRIPALYSPLEINKNNNNIPQTKLYVKIPRKNYSLKMLHNVIKNGESIISNGPFIRFFVENINIAHPETAGADNSDWINGNSTKIGGIAFTNKQTRNIFAEAYTCSEPTDFIDHIDLIYNGKIIRSTQATQNQKSLQINWQLSLKETGWLQLRYYSTNSNFSAITNPIYVINFNNKQPEPAMSKTQIQVIDKKTGKPVPAKITVLNFGIIIDSFTMSRHSLIVQVPATANIIVEAKGYKTKKKNIYLHGGSAEYINMLNKKGLLGRAQEDPITYKYLHKALLNSKLLFQLEKK